MAGTGGGRTCRAPNPARGPGRGVAPRLLWRTIRRVPLPEASIWPRKPPQLPDAPGVCPKLRGVLGTWRDPRVTPRHHIGDDLLLSYAAGSLAEGWSACRRHPTWPVAPFAASAWRAGRSSGRSILVRRPPISPESRPEPSSWAADPFASGRGPGAGAPLQPVTAILPSLPCATSISAVTSTRSNGRALGKGARRPRIPQPVTAELQVHR